MPGGLSLIHKVLWYSKMYSRHLFSYGGLNHPARRETLKSFPKPDSCLDVATLATSSFKDCPLAFLEGDEEKQSKGRLVASLSQAQVLNTIH